jgi:adenine-specific DNA-methyltransferase
MQKFPPPQNGTGSHAENIARLKALFPELVMEGKQGASVNVDVLKQLVGDATVTDLGEKFGLNWFGKREARKLALIPSLGTLRPAPDESLDWDTTRNLMIEGDNLEVLKLLQESYAGMVKLIYIDPPYNTGKDFVYPDNFADGVRNYKELTGQTENGKALSSNIESSGRFHTNWLNMMYPRLKVAREFLRDDGLIAISMDDHELAPLRLICDEIFGEECFIGTLTWITTTQPDNIGRARFGLQQNIEYVLVYSKSPRLDLPPFILETKGIAPRYPHQGKFGPCRFEIIERAFEGAYARPTMRFKILGQNPREGKQWQIGEEQARDLEARGRIEIVEGIVKKAIYPEDETEDDTSYVPFWAHLKNTQTSQRGKAEVTELLGAAHGMDTVKPTSLLREILKHLPKDALILDFFAGSGTSGDAVLRANVEDDGNRRFILTQLPLPLDPKESSQRSSHDFCKKIGVPEVLSELTKERLRRAAAKIQAENSDWKGDVGFRVLKLDTSNLLPWNPETEDLEAHLLEHENRILPGRGDLDLLYEVMIRLGIGPSSPIETKVIASKIVRCVSGGRLFACFANSIASGEASALAAGIAAWREQLAPESESRAIFLDASFADDVAKANLNGLLGQQGFQEDHILSL